jgi:hypothetical protein
MSEDVTETENEQLITFDGEEFKFSELSDEAKHMVNQISILENDIVQTRMAVDRHEAAKKTFIEALREELKPTEPE